MSTRKHRVDEGSRADKGTLKQGERVVGEVDRLLKKHAKRVKPKDEAKLRLALDEARDALDEGQDKRISVALKDLEHRADQVLGFARKSTTREYVESIGIAVLIAVLLRFFVLEAFKIPTGSMIPTLEIGDHIFVNKFIYGLRVPLSTESWFARWGSPERGHVIVFRYPKRPSKDYIKRVVAVAGDRVRVRGHDVWVNGQKLTHGDRKNFRAFDQTFGHVPFASYDETSRDTGQEYTVQYRIGADSLRRFPYFDPLHRSMYRDPQLDGLRCPKSEDGPPECTVEPGYVFVMGDNRDNSEDSRAWGGVPHRLVKGRAMFVWFSWGPDGIDWGRFGKAVR